MKGTLPGTMMGVMCPGAKEESSGIPGTLPAEGNDGTEGNGMPSSGRFVANAVPA